mmetsp:Transcript_3654/g.8730  ORF Transcript_3654/g.8730 Transcript_3654/m.8730 type:complete len:205 (+) Transcript_3654:2482-3096(+)
MTAVAVPKHNATSHVASLQRQKRQVVTNRLARTRPHVARSAYVQYVRLHFEGGVSVAVVPDGKLVVGALAGLAQDHHVVLGQRFVCRAREFVFVGFVRALVHQGEMTHLLADPARLEFQLVVRGGRRPARPALRRGHTTRPRKKTLPGLGWGVGEDGLDLPVVWRRVHDRDLLDDLLPRVRLERQRTLRVRRRARTFDLVYSCV